MASHADAYLESADALKELLKAERALNREREKAYAEIERHHTYMNSIQFSNFTEWVEMAARLKDLGIDPSLVIKATEDKSA